MRNWAFSRKGGGAENSLVARSVAVVTIETTADDAGSAFTTAGPAAMSVEGLGESVTSSSGLLFGLDIEQLPSQHGIEARIAVIAQPGLSRQQPVAAGKAVTIRASARAIAVAIRFVIDALVGCTV
ncbi:MAG TPA: hypothetical protein VEZ11_10340 [Thermoanaerobaculia bacterium]|nr:hypothetical protein [Thermoanaerobaculia bacterium]